jgi:hypothetical protein
MGDDFFGDFFDFTNVNEPDISAPASAPVSAPPAPLSGVGDAGSLISSGFDALTTGQVSSPFTTNPSFSGLGGFYNAPEDTSSSMKGLSDWVKGNQTVAAALVTGIMSALGGMGKAGLDRQTLERKAQLDQEALNAIVTRKSAGTYRGSLGMGPSGNQVLMRPSGGPVYDPGTGQIIRPGLINQAQRA